MSELILIIVNSFLKRDLANASATASPIANYRLIIIWGAGGLNTVYQQP
jgi:hypothetical protein